MTASTRTQRRTRTSRASASRSQPRRVGLAGGWLQRRQPEKSGVQKMIGRVSGALPGHGKARTKVAASPSGAKRAGQVGGFAVLTAVAGLAFKNRDKIASKLSRGQSAADHGHGAPGTTGRSETAVGTPTVP